MWKGIKELPQKQRSKYNGICIELNGKLKNDQYEVANSFNNYFTKITSKLVKIMKPATRHHKDYLLNIFLN